MNYSRRDFLKIAGVGVVAVTFFPKISLAAAKNQIIAIRTGTQPGGKTRLVIETTARPTYSLSYPNGQIIININAICKASPSMIEGTLISGIDTKNNQIIVHTKKNISPIPSNQILVLNPSGGSKYRLVLDFTAGKASDKSKTASEAIIAKKTTGTRKPIIVIDPGHGGRDPGCIGITGTQEKDIVLSVAKKLNAKLNASGYNSTLTRKNDTFLNLNTRSGIAEKRKADLFISIHANSNPKKSIKGFSVYTLSQKASDIEAQKVADAENAADKIEVDGFEKFEPNVRNALSALQQHMVAEDSVALAEQILSFTSKYGITRVDKARRFAPFAVLKSTVPSCLVELGHLSNRAEESILRGGSYQEKLASSISDAISKFDFES